MELPVFYQENRMLKPRKFKEREDVRWKHKDRQATFQKPEPEPMEPELGFFEDPKRQAGLSNILADIAMAFTGQYPTSIAGGLAGRAKTGAQALLFRQAAETGEIPAGLEVGAAREARELGLRERAAESQEEFQQQQLALLEQRAAMEDISESEAFDLGMRKVAETARLDVAGKLRVMEETATRRYEDMQKEWQLKAPGRVLDKLLLGSTYMREGIKAIEAASPTDISGAEITPGLRKELMEGLYRQLEAGGWIPSGMADAWSGKEKGVAEPPLRGESEPIDYTQKALELQEEVKPPEEEKPLTEVPKEIREKEGIGGRFTRFIGGLPKARLDYQPSFTYIDTKYPEFNSLSEEEKLKLLIEKEKFSEERARTFIAEKGKTK